MISHCCLSDVSTAFSHNYNLRDHHSTAVFRFGTHTRHKVLNLRPTELATFVEAYEGILQLIVPCGRYTTRGVLGHLPHVAMWNRLYLPSLACRLGLSNTYNPTPLLSSRIVVTPRFLHFRILWHGIVPKGCPPL